MEVGARLRALIAQFEYDKYGECFACGALKETSRHGVLYEDSTQPCWVGKLKAELDALLSAPVGSLCTCLVMTQGILDRKPDCPVHGGSATVVEDEP